MIRTIVIMFLVVITLTSCVSKKKILYFQNDESTSYVNKKGFELEFQNDDLLVVNISSENLEAVKSFNLPIVAFNTQTNSVNGTPRQQGYLIDNNGNINFPVLGDIKIAGLTRIEAIQLLKNKLTPYVNDVQVNIQILNFKINVLGDVKNPGTFKIQNERVTILDALALAGDLNISGERTIEIKRETAKGIITGIIDLKSNKIFSSDFFYLKQNDVVYVNPNKAKIQSSSYSQNTGLFISIASVLISLISILTR